MDIRIRAGCLMTGISLPGHIDNTDNNDNDMAVTGGRRRATPGAERQWLPHLGLTILCAFGKLIQSWKPCRSSPPVVIGICTGQQL
jgi:hypothetical protein